MVKVVLKRAVGKWSQSATKVAQQLAHKGYPVSDRTAQRCWKKILGRRAYEFASGQKLMEKQRVNCINFCEKCKNWTADDWKRLLFSDESVFGLFHPSNPQNDRVWAQDPAKMLKAPSVKFPSKLMLRGMMSCQGTSDPHVIPARTSVDTGY